MANEHRARGVVIVSLLSGILGALLAGALVVALRLHSRAAPRATASERPSTDAGEADDAVARRHFRSALARPPSPPPPSEPAARTVRPLPAPPERYADASHRVLDDLKKLAATKAGHGAHAPVELQANQMGDYIYGTIKTIRAVDPNMFLALRNDFESDICNGSATDLDLMVFAKFANVQMEVASPRTFHCALSGRTKEDATMWSLLDAWNNAGRPPIPEVEDIKRNATDPRTLSRFLSQEEQAAKAQAHYARSKSEASNPKPPPIGPYVEKVNGGRVDR